VFHPKLFLSSLVLAKYLRTLDVKGKRVLDCGTGSGVLGIIAARNGAEVTAIDINALAIEAARENAERNHVTMRILQSDWFSALEGETFDLIVCNPPFVRSSGKHHHSAAWHAGEAYEHVLGFIEGCDAHLAPGGKLLLVLTSHADVEWWIDELASEGLSGEIILHKRMLFEEVMIFEFDA
jgi:release factor glutamine methyltransferase